MYMRASVSDGDMASAAEGLRGALEVLGEELSGYLFEGEYAVARYLDGLTLADGSKVRASCDEDDVDTARVWLGTDDGWFGPFSVYVAEIDRGCDSCGWLAVDGDGRPGCGASGSIAPLPEHEVCWRYSPAD